MTTSGTENSPPESAKAMRERVPRSSLGALDLPADRDPLTILEQQNADRLPDLVGVRIGRMLQSPFAFYRGAAAVMAADLADTPTPGPRVVSSGDAHISNFGFFASPERELVFDLNDFDEAAIAPWDWDLRRMATSIHIAGRGKGLSESDCRDATVAAIDAYRGALRELMTRSALDRYYATVDAEDVEAKLRGKDRKEADRLADKARRNTSARVLDRLTTEEGDGTVRIIDQPPLTRHSDVLAPPEVEEMFRRYLRTVREDVALLLGQHKPVDAVLRVVGVGSVGTRCLLVALQDPDDEVLFLQVKEAPPSVLTTYGKMPLVLQGHDNGLDTSQGRRVVAAQRILQAQSDPFLGYVTGRAAGAGRQVDYYWRQFRDMKGSVDTDRLTKSQFTLYGVLCGQLLARAHSQSPGAHAAAAYLGSGDVAVVALADWAGAYADQSEADHAALAAAAAAGRFPVQAGV